MAIPTFFACNDALEWTPETELATSSFWTSANDCKLYANSYYNLFLANYRKSQALTIGTFESDYTTDNAVKGGYVGMLNGETSAPTAGGGSNGFEFEQIAKLNYFLANYTRYTGTFESIKDYVGETYFFHSLMYFNRVKKFGNFQYTRKVLSIDSPELYLPRLPRNQVIDSVLYTLDLAIEYLPTRAMVKERRLTKEVALLLKSRVALFEGTWEKYHANDNFAAKVSDPEKYFRIAADAVEELMELGSCGLDNVGRTAAYNRVFNQADYTNSTEILLWRPYEKVFGHAITYTSTGGNGGGATRDLVEAYLCTNGKPIDLNTYNDNTYGDIAKDRDPRLFQSILFPFHMIYQNGGRAMYPEVTHQQAAWQNTTGYQIYKGHDWFDSARGGGQDQFAGIVATIYYRYEEALLNYAEAKAELNEITQEVLDETVNALRTRAGMPEAGLLTLGNVPNDPRNNWGVSDLIYEIRRERRVELAFEGFRMDDLKRWAVLTKVMRDWKPFGVKEELYQVNTLLTTLVAEQPLGLDPIVDKDGHNVLQKMITDIIYDKDNIPIDTIYMTMGMLRKDWFPNPSQEVEGAIIRKFVADESRGNVKYMDPYTGKDAPDISLSAGYSIPEKLYLSPIPKVEISINNKIAQNPGW